MLRAAQDFVYFLEDLSGIEQLSNE